MHFRGYFGKGQVETIRQHFVPLAAGGGNSAWFETASGKKLSAGVPAYAKALEEFRNLPEADRKPAALAPAAADRFAAEFPVPGGAVAVRTYLRYLAREPGGELRPRVRLLSPEEKKGQGASVAAEENGPNRDFFYLTAEEAKSLVPRDPRVGDRRPVPSGVTARLFVCHLFDGVTGCGPFWRREHLKAGELTLTVEEASAAGVRMRLEGFARLHAEEDWKAEWKILGFVHAKKGELDRFDFVALGESHFRGKRLIGIAGELAPPGSLGFGSLPYWCRHDLQGKAYFAMKGDSP